MGWRTSIDARGVRAARPWKEHLHDASDQARLQEDRIEREAEKLDRHGGRAANAPRRIILKHLTHAGMLILTCKKHQWPVHRPRDRSRIVKDIMTPKFPPTLRPRR